MTYRQRMAAHILTGVLLGMIAAVVFTTGLSFAAGLPIRGEAFATVSFLFVIMGAFVALVHFEGHTKAPAVL